MNPLTDQQLQELLDAQFRQHNNTPPPDIANGDFGLYQHLFEALATEPPQTVLPYSFAANVTRQIQKKELARSERRTWVLYGLSLLLLPAVTVGILILAPGYPIHKLMETGSRFGLPALLVLAGFGLVQWADYRLIKRAGKHPSILSGKRTT